jgi:predicted Zn-ribbon and HTH transcriptional regulator
MIDKELMGIARQVYEEKGWEGITESFRLKPEPLTGWETEDRPFTSEEWEHTALKKNTDWTYEQYCIAYVRLKSGEQPAKCDACGTSKHHYHFLGCDMERCPKCKGQLISCECWGDDLEDLDDNCTDIYEYGRIQYGDEEPL